jgi:hypothetical protein
MNGPPKAWYAVPIVLLMVGAIFLLIGLSYAERQECGGLPSPNGSGPGITCQPIGARAVVAFGVFWAPLLALSAVSWTLLWHLRHRAFKSPYDGRGSSYSVSPRRQALAAITLSVGIFCAFIFGLSVQNWILAELVIAAIVGGLLIVFLIPLPQATG